MCSLEATERATNLDEAALYLAAAVALGAALLAVGGGSGSATVGLAGAALAAVGTFVSWRTRQLSMKKALAIGGVLGSAAMFVFWALVARELESEESRLYHAFAEPALMSALRMAAFQVLLSFLLIRPDVTSFSLVPPLTMFGLVAGRGEGVIVGSCFLLFMPAALVVLGEAMLLSGLPGYDAKTGRLPRQAPQQFGWELRGWRRRHWLTMGSLIAAIMVLGWVLFVPIATYGSQYRWPLIIGITSGGRTMMTGMPQERREIQSYPIGRGPIAPTDAPVLTVEGSPIPFWRGAVFDLYTGAAWLRSEEAGPNEVGVIANTIDVSGRFPAPSDVAPETHVVRAEVDQPFVLHAPGYVQHIRALPPMVLPEHIRVDGYGRVDAVDQLLLRGLSYRVVSVPLEMGPHGRVDESGEEASPSAVGSPEVPSASLTVPMGARRVADQARRIAGNEPTADRKLVALISYLHQNCVYTLDAPAIPTGEDAADYFLFEQRRGYCDLFATTLALMARAVGVPTRLVTGYAGGEYDNEHGVYMLRESDAHAWVEAYVLPWGWVTVDPAPAGEAPPMPASRRALLRIRFFFQDHPVSGGAVAAGVAAMVAFGALFVRRRLWERLRRGASAAGPRAAVLHAYAQVCGLLRRFGLGRRPSQTALEFLVGVESAASEEADVARKRSRLPGSLPSLRTLTELFLCARYGPGPVNEEAARAAFAALAEVRQQLRGR